MKLSIYLDTSTISYLTTQGSHDLIIATHQQITQEWWRQDSHSFDLYASELVRSERSQTWGPSGSQQTPKYN